MIDHSKRGKREQEEPKQSKANPPCSNSPKDLCIVAQIRTRAAEEEARN